MLYLMSCNLSEILIVGLAAAVTSPLPILPLQILFLNLVTDVFPALALGMSRGHGEQMLLQPRRSCEAILRRRDWWQIVGYSVLISACVLGKFALALLQFRLGLGEAVTIAFVSLAGAQLIHVFNMRAPAEHPIVNQITRNRYVWAAIGLCTTLLAAAIHIPAIATTLALQPPSKIGWLLILIAAILPLLVTQAGALLQATIWRKRTE